MHVFLLDPTTSLQAGSRLTIDGAEGHHAVKVRRVAIGEEVELVDGIGTRARSTVTAVGKRSFTVEVSAVRHEEPGKPAITVVQAVLKSDRSERAVELMSEVGVDRIVPWQARRCISVWDDEKRVKAIAKWQTVAREAAKQSRQSRVTQIAPLADDRGVEELIRSAGQAYLLHESAAPFRIEDVTSETVTLIVGPEGGLTDEEVADFTAAGAQPMQLGPTVLRGSTAGAIGAAVLLARSTRWKETTE